MQVKINKEASTHLDALQVEADAIAQRLHIALLERPEPVEGAQPLHRTHLAVNEGLLGRRELARDHALMPLQLHLKDGLLFFCFISDFKNSIVYVFIFFIFKIFKQLISTSKNQMFLLLFNKKKGN